MQTIRVLSSAAAGVVLSASMALAGTPLDPGVFGGGFVPPDKDTSKAEHGLGKNLTKFAASVTKCYQKGVTNVFNSKPSGVTECVQKANDKAALTEAKFAATTPACLNAAALRANVDGLVASFNAVIFCEAPANTPLPAEFTGGVIPTDKDVNKLEQAVSKALIKHVGAVQKCYDKGVSNVEKGKPDGVAACLAKAQAKYDKGLPKLDTSGFDPTCLNGGNAPSMLDDVVAGLTQSFIPSTYCASPSGAFLIPIDD